MGGWIDGWIQETSPTPQPHLHPGRLPASVVGVEQDALWQRVLGGGGAAGPRVQMPLQVTHGTPLLLLQVVASTFGGASRMRVGYCVALMLVCVLDFVMAVLLALFGGWRAPDPNPNPNPHPNLDPNPDPGPSPDPNPYP